LNCFGCPIRQIESSCFRFFWPAKLRDQREPARNRASSYPFNVEHPTIRLCFLENPIDFLALDGLPVTVSFTLMTGCVSRNMLLGLKKTYEAAPDPKIVSAARTCPVSDGPFIDHPEIHHGIGSISPVNPYVPGCPLHPITQLDGLLRLPGTI